MGEQGGTGVVGGDGFERVGGFPAVVGPGFAGGDPVAQGGVVERGGKGVEVPELAAEQEVLAAFETDRAMDFEGTLEAVADFAAVEVERGAVVAVAHRDVGPAVEAGGVDEQGREVAAGVLVDDHPVAADRDPAEGGAFRQQVVGGWREDRVVAALGKAGETAVAFGGKLDVGLGFDPAGVGEGAARAAGGRGGGGRRQQRLAVEGGRHDGAGGGCAGAEDDEGRAVGAEGDVGADAAGAGRDGVERADRAAFRVPEFGPLAGDAEFTGPDGGLAGGGEEIEIELPGGAVDPAELRRGGKVRGDAEPAQGLGRGDAAEDAAAAEAAVRRAVAAPELGGELLQFEIGLGQPAQAGRGERRLAEEGGAFLDQVVELSQAGEAHGAVVVDGDERVARAAGQGGPPVAHDDVLEAVRAAGVVVVAGDRAVLEAVQRLLGYQREDVGDGRPLAQHQLAAGEVVVPGLRPLPPGLGAVVVLTPLAHGHAGGDLGEPLHGEAVDLQAIGPEAEGAVADGLERRGMGEPALGLRGGEGFRADDGVAVELGGGSGGLDGQAVVVGLEGMAPELAGRLVAVVRGVEVVAGGDVGLDGEAHVAGVAEAAELGPEVLGDQLGDGQAEIEKEALRGPQVGDHPAC